MRYDSILHRGSCVSLSVVLGSISEPGAENGTFADPCIVPMLVVAIPTAGDNGLERRRRKNSGDEHLHLERSCVVLCIGGSVLRTSGYCLSS